MKDKPSKSQSMNDYLEELKASEPVATQREAEISNIESENYDEKMYDSIVEYNSKVETLDPDYTSIQPMSDVLVRVFLQVPEKTSYGLIIPIKKQLQVPTKAGVGAWYEVESPFPYTTKAVVVSVPKMLQETLKPGQVVQLGNDQVVARIVGNGENASVEVKNGYLHPDATHATKDPNDKYYGYLLIPSFEIKTIIKNV